MTADIRRAFNRFTYVFFFFHGCFFAGNQLLVHHTAAAVSGGNSRLSLLIGSLYVGSMVMVVLLGELSERAGKRLGGLVAALSYSLGAFLVAVSKDAAFAAFAYFLYGCGTGALEGIWFSLIGDINGPETGRQMNLSQAVFSVGAVFGPVAIEWLLGYIPYRAFYCFTGIFTLALACLFLLLRRLDEFTVRAERGSSGSAVLRLARSPMMLALMLVLIISTGSETALTYWLPNYFGLFGAAALGAAGLSAYWFASIPGRLLASRLKNQSLSLVFSFSFCALGVLMILLIPAPPLKLIGVLMTGIALAPVYPNISTLGGRLFPQSSAAAFSLMVFSCGLGGTLAQPLIGAVSQRLSITAVYSAIVIIMLVLTLLSVWISRSLAKRGETDR